MPWDDLHNNRLALFSNKGIGKTKEKKNTPDHYVPSLGIVTVSNKKFLKAISHLRHKHSNTQARVPNLLLNFMHKQRGCVWLNFRPIRGMEASPHVWTQTGLCPTSGQWETASSHVDYAGCIWDEEVKFLYLIKVLCLLWKTSKSFWGRQARSGQALQQLSE